MAFLALFGVAVVVLLVALLASQVPGVRRLLRRYRPLDVLGVAAIAIVGLWGLVGLVLAIPGFPVEAVPSVLTTIAVGLYLQRIVGDARDSVVFSAPVRLDYAVPIFVAGEENPRQGKAYVDRIGIESRRTEDDISFEVHVSPAVDGEELVSPPVHLERTKTQYLNDQNRLRLRHGQRAFVDITGARQTEKGWECLILKVDRYGSEGSFWRRGLTLNQGRYELVLKVFFSDRRNDEKRYRVNADPATGKLELRGVWP